MSHGPLLKLLICFAVPTTLLLAQDKSPTRKVQANALTSGHDPKVRIELPKSVQYVGADRWDLYGVADCELHLFVEADAQKKVQRFYWIQFEAMLPSNLNGRYNYNSPQHIQMADMDFDVRVRFGPNDDAARAGSDLEHLRNLLKSKGYILPAGSVSVRLVHMPDEQKRKELMIIYAEDIGPTGFTAMDLLPGGKGADHWPEIEKAALQRARKELKLTR